MTHVCCPTCRLRFDRASAAHLVTCPQCGRAPQPLPHGELALGYRLFSDEPVELPQAVAVAVAVPVPLTGPPKP